jgi:hypothetical protein
VLRNDTFRGHGAGLHDDHGRASCGALPVVLYRFVGDRAVLLDEEGSQSRHDNSVFQVTMFDLKGSKEFFQHGIIIIPPKYDNLLVSIARPEMVGVVKILSNKKAAIPEKPAEKQCQWERPTIKFQDRPV